MIPGNTPLLTSTGYQTVAALVGQETQVWNGHDWETTIPYAAGAQPLHRVWLSDGTYLDCTPIHTFIMQPTGTQVSSRKMVSLLSPGERLADFDMPSLANAEALPKSIIDSLGKTIIDSEGSRIVVHLGTNKQAANLRMMLTLCGCHARIKERRLDINYDDTYRLGYANRMPDRSGRKSIQVVEVQDLHRTEPTFGIAMPRARTATFAGIVTSDCG
jgi:hypothetical protein